VYIIELSGKTWEYVTAEEAWNNKHLGVRKNCPPMNPTDSCNSIFGVREFTEFQRLLDSGAVLQYHAMKVYKLS